MSSPITKKRRARKLALQALYQWFMSASELYDIDAQCRVANNMERLDAEYFSYLLYTIPKELPNIEAMFEPLLDRPLQQLNPIELTILRICTFEMMHCPELPYRVILDESISMAKEFGAKDGHRYVNGVLHQLATKIRTVEMSQEHRE